MSTTYHTDIAVGAAANASVFNAPLGQLDAILGDAMSYGINNNAELVAARSPYASLDARLDALVMAGGNVATKANGVSAAGQKVLTVDSTTDFVVGAYVTYLLNGATLEGNTIASIQAGVSLTLGTNIGASPAGGVLDDSYISMISISEYLAAQAIPHAGTLMLPDTIEYVNRGVHHVDAYGAVGNGTTDDTAAIQAALDAANAAGGGQVEFAAGKTYKVNAYAGGVFVYSNTRVVGNGAKIYMYGDYATLANGAASAGQKVVTLDSTTGMHAGDYVQYALASSAETNQIDTVDSPTQVTLTTNIGGTGIPNNGTFGLYYVTAANTVCAFSIDDDQNNVEISGLEIYGDNSPYYRYGDLQSNGVWIGNTAATANIWIHHCVFRNLYGFSMHCGGAARYVSITDNYIFECANGINVNADYAVTSRNVLIYTEGIETSGSYSIVSDNVLASCKSGVSMGGSSGSPGMICTGNSITDTEEGEGIATGDGAFDCRITNNVITRTYGVGILAVTSGTPGYGDCTNLTISGNTIRSAGYDVAGNESNQVGIYVAGQSGPLHVTGVTISNNRIFYDAADTDHTMRTGLLTIYVDKLTVEGNVVAGMSNRDLDIEGCTNVALGRNTCDPATVYFASNTYATQLVPNYVPVGPWYQDNAAANQSAVVLNLVGGERAEIPMVLPGDIVGIAVYSNEYRAAGTLTVAATKNGTALSGAGLTAVLNGTTPYAKQTFISFPGVQFLAGDMLGVKITTDGSWGPTTADITVSVLVIVR